MFRIIAHNRRLARATQLRKEFSDFIERFDASDDQSQDKIWNCINSIYKNLISYNKIETLTDKEKKQLAKELLKKAKLSFNSDIYKGNALFFLSAYIESQTLPGSDSTFVFSQAQRILDQVIKNELSEGNQESAVNLEEVEYYLKRMGYDLLTSGIIVAQASFSSGYNAVETASLIAVTTMALDVKEVGDEIDSLLSFFPHGIALLEVLKEHKENNRMRDSIWENDTNAIKHIITVDENQLEWIDKILSDPISGTERLAVARRNKK